MIAELMVYYKGAITYQDFMTMPICEILDWQERAKKLTDNYNQEIERREEQTRRQ